MQNGKEPLRSFSDLLQFMKKERDETVTEKVVVKPSDTAEASQGKTDSANDSVVNQADTTERGDASDTSA